MYDGSVLLHITNGDSAAGTLAQAGLEGRVTTSSDLLHEGPVPVELDPGQLREVRARYLADCGYAPYDKALELFRREDTLLDEATSRGDDIVLWFEHDLFDQLILIRLLDRLSRNAAAAGARSLICIGEFPGIDRFVGLGQLTATQLASLFPARCEITGAQFDLARSAWMAFRSADPVAVDRLREGDCSALAFLGAALTRLLEEYPSVEDGLGRTERSALEALRGGSATATSLFLAVSRAEERPFLGDAPFFGLLYRLAGARNPLVEIEAAPASSARPSRAEATRRADVLAMTGPRQVSLTSFGHQVLAGLADLVRANGIDRWIGGVHLQGDEARWRWDRTRRAIVAREPRP